MVTPQLQERGFGLIESLVALFVVSVGILGVMAIQGQAGALSSGSDARSRASALAENMAAMIRANPAGAHAGDFDGLDHVSTAAAPRDCTPDDPCAPQEMAFFEAWHWDRALDGHLNNGQGSIECSYSPAGGCLQYLVRVRWHARGKTPPSVASCGQIITPFAGCYQIWVTP